jgi:hypothetical protein
MRNGLKVSLLCNLALAGGLIFVLVAGHRTVPVGSAPVVAESRPPVIEAATPPISSRPEPAPFRWSQLDSTNYHQYVKNLRGIGCPEPTLRAIVTADVHAVLWKRALALEQQLAALAEARRSGRPDAGNNEPALRSEMAALPEEEAAEIARLLGLSSSTNSVASAPLAPVRPGRQPRSQANRPVDMPLVFQNVDPVELGLNEEQMQVVNNLREDFTQQVGGENQDPNDPAYLARWQQAQPAMDDMLQGMLGEQVYTKLQMLQLTGGTQAAQPPPQN